MKRKTVVYITGIILIAVGVFCTFQNFMSLRPAQINLVETEKLVSSQNEFGFKLFKQLTQEKTENVFISPLSISLVLLTSYNGAQENTKEEMAETLEIGQLTSDELNTASRNLIDFLHNPGSQIQIYVANSVWGSKKIEFKKEFLKTARNYFDAEVKSLDFDSEAVKTINDWARKKTKGKIPKIIDKIETGPDTEQVILLVNALYFKGMWTEKFDEDLTRERKFYLVDGTEKMVPMMKNTEYYYYTENEDFQAINIPYGKEEGLSMFVFLPKGDPRDFITRLNTENWEEWMNSFEDKEGTIILPKFRIEYEKELKETLMLLGMEKAFDPYLADFTGIGEYRDDSVTTEEPRRIYIDSAFHKTFIEVNEEGTEAASTFHLWFGTMGAPEEDLFYMEVNRPFFFVIRENRTGVLLFMGYIADPPVVD